MERRLPVATMGVFALTAAVTGVSRLDPAVTSALRRDPTALAAGEWWRLVTPLLVQPDVWWSTLSVLAALAVVGAVVEWRFGVHRWLLCYLGGGLVGELAGYAWQPFGAGASVGVAGLLGALLAWLLLDGRDRPLRVRAWGPIGIVAALVLVILRDIHGPPLLFGVAVHVALHLRRDCAGK